MNAARAAYAAGILLPVAGAAALPALLICAVSPEPARTLAAFFFGPWSNAWYAGNTLDGAALLLTAALGAAFAFRGGCFNLGCEGQIYLGGCAAAAVLLLPAPGIPDAALLALAGLAALACGGLMGGLSGLLRRAAGANELITSFLLAAALIPVGDYLIAGPLHSGAGNLLASAPFAPGRLLPKLFAPSALSLSAPLSLCLAILTFAGIRGTTAGYRFRISGAAPRLARLGGIIPERRFIPALAVSGAFGGLCGFFAAAGTYGRAYSGFSGGLGWTAIAAALIARNNALALIPASLVLAALKAGSEAVLLQAGFGFQTAAIIQAAVLLLAALPLGRRAGAERTP